MWNHEHERRCREALAAWRTAAGPERQRRRNAMLTRLLLPHVARWTQAHLGKLRLASDAQFPDRQQYVLTAVTGRLLQNNERELIQLAELPPPAADAAPPDDGADDGSADDALPTGLEATALIAVPMPAADQEAVTGTPIRQRLFRLKSLCVYDCLRNRRVPYLAGPDDEAPATTLMSAGVRAGSHSLSFLVDSPAAGALSADQVARLDLAMERDLPAQIDALVSSWPSDRRRSYLAWIEGLAPREIAEELHLGLAAVRRHLDTARAAVEKLVDKQLAAPEQS